MKGIHNYEQFLDIKLEECDFKPDSEVRKEEPVIADQDTFPCNECGKTLGKVSIKKKHSFYGIFHN